MRLHQRRISFRLGAGAAAAMAVASVVAFSGAAQAGSGSADLVVSVPGTSVVQDAGKPFAINVHNNGPTKATGIKLVIDTSKLDPAKLEVIEPSDLAGCNVKAGIFTCPVPDLPPGGNYNGFTRSDPNLPVPDLAVRAIGATGHAGTFAVSVRSRTADPNKKNNRAQTKVNVVKRGIDVVAWAQDVQPSANGANRLKPGQTGDLQWMVWNQGKDPIKGVEYTVVLPHYLTFDPLRPECGYEADDTVAHCQEPDVVIGSGEAFGSFSLDHPGSDPIRVRLAPNAPGPMSLTGGLVIGHALGVCHEDCAPETSSLTSSSASPQRAGVLSAAEAMKAKNSVKGRNDDRTAREADPNDNGAPFSAFTARNPADLSISAAPVSGQVGDTVNADLTVENAGPADALVTKVVLIAPTGAEFVTVDHEACTAVVEGTEYICDLGTAPAGVSGTSTVGLKIVSSTVTDGVVEVASTVDDPNPENNMAAIKVTVLENSTPASEPASPSPVPTSPSPVPTSPSPVPTSPSPVPTSPSPMPTSPSPVPKSPSAHPSSPSAAPVVPQAGGTGGGSVGRLPVTGSPTGLFGVLGLGMAAVGGVLMVLARRRRAVSGSPID